MKKSKIILTSLAVVAIVGSALAFKAANFNSTVFCSTSSSTGADCAIFQTTTYTANSQGSSFCTSDGSPTRVCNIQSNISSLQ